MSEMMKPSFSAKQPPKPGGLSTTQEVLEQMAHPKPARPLTKIAHSPSKTMKTIDNGTSLLTTLSNF
jgi:hypothetical protein